MWNEQFIIFDTHAYSIALKNPGCRICKTSKTDTEIQVDEREKFSDRRG